MKNVREEKMKLLAEAVRIREELIAADTEIIKVSHLIRNLPQRKRKLFRLRDNLCERYNKLILEKDLPLRKVL